MEDFFSLVSRCGGQAVARFPGPWLHLASIHRLENGCGIMGTLARRSHGATVACRAVQTGRGALPWAACLGMVTGQSLKITPKPRRNTCP